MAIEIEEWEIWHTYTTFLESTQIDLPDIARRLVSSRIAECVMLNDGRTYWRSGEIVETGVTSVGVDHVSGNSTFQLTREKGTSQPEGFSLEAWGQAVYESGILMVELRMIGPDSVTTLPDFITGAVNLFRYKFDHVMVNPGLVSFATRAYHQSDYQGNFIRRLQLIWRQAGHDVAVRQMLQYVK